MRYYVDDQKYVVIFAKGEELTDSLRQFTQQTGVSSAWLQGLGAALEVEVGYYDLVSQKYQWQTFKGPIEITSLQGNIVQKDGEPVFHVHGTFADKAYNCFGGHVKKLVVAATCEVFVQKINHPLTRRHDDAVGLELLQTTKD